MTPRAFATSAATSVLAAIAMGSGCTGDVLVGADRLSAAPSDASAGAGDAPPAAECVPAECAGHLYDCGDCADNDGDGKVDLVDPDCVGPCQNSEAGFFGAIPGQSNPRCSQDCYFDPNSGGGDDRCSYSHACDPLSRDAPRCPYDPDEGNCDLQQPAACETNCGPLTPNGCDCFGCCKVEGIATPIWLGSVDSTGNPSCSFDTASDPAACHPCTQVTSCLNECEDCELCVGRTRLPDSCRLTDDEACPAPRCPERSTPCGLACLPACPSGQVCITGCCTETPR